MTLTLSMLRCPDGVAPETRELSGGAVIIGRSPSSDWVLPDPERVLSKRHCVVSFENGDWYVTDTSANGTFVNHDTDRLASDEPRPLRDGDRLLLGSYEIEATIRHEAPLAIGSARPMGLPSDGERLTGDPFARLEDDFFGIALPPADPSIDFGRTTPDNVSAISANFRPPIPSVELLPEDWDLDLPQTPAAVPAPTPSAGVTPAPVAEPAPRTEPEPSPVTPVPAPAANGDQAFAAFAAGAGITTGVPADPLAVLNGLGAAFRAFVSGLRRIMIARAAIKGEFRIDQTMIQATGNNPLKFSADDQDAMMALLGVGRPVDMSPERAVSEAMRDARLHELAMATAMQQAVRDLIAGLGPARVADRTAADVLDFLPWRRAARQWEAYQSLHHATAQALTEDFDNLFGKSFMRAYERAMSEIDVEQTG
jgi:type VI secretion system protein ImpI/type VI secretion system protein